jgi:hypothetical protein
MKTTKGMVINFLGDGGVSIRADWIENSKPQPISGKDYTPELLFKFVEDMRKSR